MFFESCLILWTILSFIQSSEKSLSSVTKDRKFENMNSETSEKAEDSSRLFVELSDLLLWRNFRVTLIVFTSVLLLLLDVMSHSVISVVSMAGITVLLAAMGHRCFLQLWRTWKKDGSRDPISRWYPQVKIDIPREETMRLAGTAVTYLNKMLNRLLGLFLVDKWEDSLKFLALLCGVNLLGDCLNGLTMLLFGHLFIFTLPKLYELYKPLIDAQVRKFGKCKPQEKNEVENKSEKTDNFQEEYPTEVPQESQESGDGNILYLLEEEHRKGCRCRDCEHQDLPIEAH
ncbi:reticulon-1-A [Drosophila rhopaloa]|uniref:Reticulon-like protein n=2 Tax=Drosophila rhopaloa TaxID=1041015 RepID=A0ABM5J1S4_DRORH|nr:reticulon-1-A [Drosophila rhopaloa]